MNPGQIEIQSLNQYNIANTSRYLFLLFHNTYLSLIENFKHFNAFPQNQFVSDNILIMKYEKNKVILIKNLNLI